MAIIFQGTPEGVEDNGTLTRVAAFPIGIDPDRFARAMLRDDVQSNINELLKRYAGRKVRPMEALIFITLAPKPFQNDTKD